MSARSPLPADVAAPWTAEIEWRADRFRVVARRGGRTAAEVLAESAPVAWPPTELHGRPGADGRAEGAGGRAHRGRLGAAVSRRRLVRGAFRVVAGGTGGRALAVAARRAPPEPLGDPAGPFAPVPAWPGDTRQRWRCEITVGRRLARIALPGRDLSPARAPRPRHRRLVPGPGQADGTARSAPGGAPRSGRRARLRARVGGLGARGPGRGLVRGTLPLACRRSAGCCRKTDGPRV